MPDHRLQTEDQRKRLGKQRLGDYVASDQRLATNQHGMSFILVLMIVSLLVIISFMLVVLNTLNLNLVSKNKDDNKAYWASQAGMSDALNQLKSNINWVSGFSNKYLPNSAARYTITFTPGASPYSTNNVSSLNAATGWNNINVPAGCIHIVAIGYSGKVEKVSQIIIKGKGNGFFQYPYLAQNKITINRGFLSDSFNSAVGSYDETHSNSNADIRSNDVANNTINIGGTSGRPSYVYGDVIAGVGANPDTAIKTTSYVTISGAKLAAAQNYNFAQMIFSGNSNNLNISGSQILPPGIYGTLTLSKNAELTLTGTEYTFKTITFGKDSKLIINAGSNPVVIYLDGNLDSGGGLIVNNTLKADHFVIYANDNCSTIKLSNDAYLAIYARGATFFPTGSLSNVYGAIAVKQINGKNNLSVHFDRALRFLKMPSEESVVNLTKKSQWLSQ